MSTRIFFLDNEILIDTIPTPFVAGSLIARMNGQAVEIGRVESDFVFTSIPWKSVAARDGSTFDTVDDAMTYVTAQLSMRRPVGTVITPYPITTSASFTVDHGLAYAPRTTIVDPSGAEVITDVAHAPGQTTLIFAAPFTGTLYLG